MKDLDSKLAKLNEDRTRFMGRLHELLPTDEDGGYADNPAWDPKTSAAESRDLIAKVRSIDDQIAQHKMRRQLDEFASDDPKPLEENAEAAARKAAAQNGKSVDENTAAQVRLRQEINNWIFSGTINGRKDNTLSDIKGEPLQVPGMQVLGQGNTVTLNPVAAASADDLRTTTDDKGGYTVPTLVYEMVTDRLVDYGDMRAVADHRTVPTGQTVRFPTADPTALRGEIVAENDEASDTTHTFGHVDLQFDYYSSKVLAVSKELLQDNTVDLGDYVMDILARAITVTQEEAFINGSTGHRARGVGQDAQPGLSLAAGKRAATDITFKDLVTLIFSVDRAYRKMGRCRFLLNDATLQALFTLDTGATADGRPVWLPDWQTGMDSGMIRGYSYTVNNQVDSAAQNAKSILFGDFMAYKIFDATLLDMMRFDDSAYQKRNQVGFMLGMRTACRLIDGGNQEGAANTRTSFAVKALRHP